MGLSSDSTTATKTLWLSQWPSNHFSENSAKRRQVSCLQRIRNSKEQGQAQDHPRSRLRQLQRAHITRISGYSKKELVCELGVYFLSFDRAGYGDSDPNPKRDAKSEATDIEELADRLDIGLKFYVIGFSMGGYPAWSCLKYIPHRLAGAALVVPVINYWWPSFPANLSKRVYRNLLVQDQITFWIAHNAPSLLCGWMTQKWIPKLSVVEGHPHIFSGDDKEIRQKMAAYAEENGFLNKPRQQGVHESLHRDLMVGFGNWEFDPMNISNPFPDDEGSVHIWQGYDDRLIPVDLQRFLVKKLPWIQYHENPKGGHLFFWTKEWSDAILGSLLRGQMPTAT
ncbi:uncharacterized protein LOC109836754 isoform X2 [Asparagus officinalis]|uniref:uncharacterized protein LOC109836754 isoform X2 n=1 Tax=Asparagus officinalis TaxID=4686 RepID=UPI00098E6958|nr:uncharacterized protein LOC109836754 isoform X2 [Asparagus officinalis]